jgi:hypothetical protein
MSAAATAAGYLFASGRLRGSRRCSKDKYQSEAAANATARRRAERGELPQRAFQCATCNYWHLTIQVGQQ